MTTLKNDDLLNETMEPLHPHLARLVRFEAVFSSFKGASASKQAGPKPVHCVASSGLPSQGTGLKPREPAAAKSHGEASMLRAQSGPDPFFTAGWLEV